MSSISQAFKTLPKRVLHSAGQWYCRETARRLHRDQQFARVNERPIEYAFLFHVIAQTSPAKVLDVGTGQTALPALMRTCGPIVSAVDNARDYHVDGLFNRHFHVIEDDIRSPRMHEQFDLISCISVIEHVADHVAAVQGMLDLLAPGGHLVMTCPYNEKTYVPNAYKLPEAGYGQEFPFVCQVYSRHEVAEWLRQSISAKIVEQQHWRVFAGEFWTCGEQLRPPRQVHSNELHQLTCLWITKS